MSKSPISYNIFCLIIIYAYLVNIYELFCCEPDDGNLVLPEALAIFKMLIYLLLELKFSIMLHPL